MPTQPHIYAGTVGLRLRVWTGVDMTGGGSVALRATKPDGTGEDWSAIIVTPSVGRLQHTVQPGELDQAGIYHFNALWTPVGEPGPKIGRTVGLTVLGVGGGSGGYPVTRLREPSDASAVGDSAVVDLVLAYLEGGGEDSIWGGDLVQAVIQS